MSATPNPVKVNPSPKETFRRSTVAKDWAEGVTSITVQTAVRSALAQFVFEQDLHSETFDGAARNALRLEGARQFMSILLNLAEKELERPLRMASDNLPNET